MNKRDPRTERVGTGHAMQTGSKKHEIHAEKDKKRRGGSMVTEINENTSGLPRTHSYTNSTVISVNLHIIAHFERIP